MREQRVEEGDVAASGALPRRLADRLLTPCLNAEFGHAQSGIINIVTREGGREFHGDVRSTTDELSDAIEQSYGYNNLQASIGGPIKLRFRAGDAQAGSVP